jgi:preprotein translocase SecE subunit
MANVQEIKAQNTAKALRLFTILLLVVGIAAVALTVFDMVSGSKLLTLFDKTAPAAAEATEAAEAAAEATATEAAATEAAATETATTDTNFGGAGVARVMLLASGVLVIVGAVLQLMKGNYRFFQGACITAIIFTLFPLIFFAVNIGSHLFALIFALIALAIIVLAFFAMKWRWQVYIKEMTGEVKKLTWLSMKELVKATAVVLVFVLAFAVLIYVLDLIFYTPVKALLTGSETTSTAEPAQEQQTGDDTAPAGEDGTENNG